MHELLLSAIVNMSVPFALCVVVIAVSIAGTIMMFRSTNEAEAMRRAREDVRSQELNQINNSLHDLRDNAQRRITYLEGFAKAKTGETQ